MKYIICLSIIPFINACSSGGGGAASSTISTASTVSGVISAGPINGATVTLYSLNSNGTQGSRLATTTADANGKYTLSISAQSGPVILIGSGGSYVEEASGSTISMGNAQIRTSLPSLSSGQQIGITPVTEIATQNILASALANGSVGLPSIISSANASVAKAMGLSDITKPPANPTQAASSASNTLGAQYAVVLAAISQMAKNASTANSTTINSLDMTQALATSFTYNGNFNSKIGAIDIPVPNAGGTSINLNSVLGGATNFNSSMQSATTTIVATMPNGFNDPSSVPPPTFVTAPPPSAGTPTLTLSTPPSTLPSTRPTVSGPPPAPTPPPVPSCNTVTTYQLATGYASSVLDAQIDTNGNIYILGTLQTSGGSSLSIVKRNTSNSLSLINTEAGATNYMAVNPSDGSIALAQSISGGTVAPIHLWSGSGWASLANAPLGSQITRSLQALSYIGGSLWAYTDAHNASTGCGILSSFNGTSWSTSSCAVSYSVPGTHKSTESVNSMGLLGGQYLLTSYTGGPTWDVMGPSYSDTPTFVGATGNTNTTWLTTYGALAAAVGWYGNSGGSAVAALRYFNGSSWSTATTWQIPTGQSTVPQSSVIDLNGNVWVTGYGIDTNNVQTGFVTEFNPNTGAQLFSKTFQNSPGRYTQGVRVLLGPSGQVYVVGHGQNTITTNDISMFVMQCQ